MKRCSKSFIELNERAKPSDQAALFLHFSDQLWLKIGIEFTQGQAWASVVVTNRWSDWSVLSPPHLKNHNRVADPAPSSQRRSLLPIPTSEPLPLKFSFKLKGPHLRVYLGSMMIREVNGFAADATAEELAHARVGVMGCSPIGEGVQVRFSDFALG